MNNYQETLMKNVIIKQMDSAEDEFLNCYQNNQIVIKQEEDIFKTEYRIVVVSELEQLIESCYLYKGEDIKKIELDSFHKCRVKCYSFLADFNDRIDYVKIEFANNLTAPVKIPVVFEEADKELYYKKQKEEQRKVFIEKINASHAAGINLVNIYFRPCSNDYHYTEIMLFLNGGLLAKYKIEKELFFLAIPNLAPNKYQYVIKQYNDKNECIVETDSLPIRVF